MCGPACCMFLRDQLKCRYLWLCHTKTALFGSPQIGRFHEIYIVYRALWVIWWFTVFTWDLVGNEIGSRWLAYFSNWSYTLLLLCCVSQLAVSIHVYFKNSKRRKSPKRTKPGHLLSLSKQEEGSVDSGVETLTFTSSDNAGSTRDTDLSSSDSQNNFTDTDNARSLLEMKPLTSDKEKCSINNANYSKSIESHHNFIDTNNETNSYRDLLEKKHKEDDLITIEKEQLTSDYSINNESSEVHSNLTATNNANQLLEIKHNEDLIKSDTENHTSSYSINDYSKSKECHSNLTENNNTSHLLAMKQKEASVTCDMEKVAVSACNEDRPEATDLPIVYKAFWFLYNISCNSAFVVTFVFWSQYIFLDITESQNSMFVSNCVHLVNSVYFITDLMISAVPIQILHFWLSFLLGLSYTFYSIVYSDEGGAIVYDALDWRQHSPAIIGLVVCMCVTSFVFHLVMFGLYWIRITLYSYCDKT